ncbi:MAG: hypothetical protein ACR2G7_06920 [Acidimicrobiales bacterium]
MLPDLFGGAAGPLLDLLGAVLCRLLQLFGGTTAKVERPVLHGLGAPP